MTSFIHKPFRTTDKIRLSVQPPLVLLLTLIFCTLIGASNAWALPEDRNQPIQLEADQAYLNHQTGKAEYTGNVVVTQGSAKLQADKVIIHSVNSEITRMEAFGDLAKYQQIMNEGEDATHIEGKKLDLELSKEIATVTGNGKVSRGKDVFTGEIIRYGLTSGELKVSGSNTSVTDAKAPSSGRVKLIFHPQSKPNNDNASEKKHDK